MPNPQISFTAVLQPSITIEQYQAIQHVIQEASEAYAHLIVSVTTNHIAPTSNRIPLSISADGMSDVDMRAAIASVMAQLVAQNPSVTWMYADGS